MDGWMNR